MDVEYPILTFDRIKDRYWCFFQETGRVFSEFFKFLPDGTIGGYIHSNERYWQIDGGILSLLNQDRVISVTFDDVKFDDGLMFLKGKHYGKTPIHCLREQTGRLQDNATRTAFAELIESLGWSIGDHTYGTPVIFEPGMANLKIGKYCSIASGVKIALGNHRTDTFTTFPFRAKNRFWEHVPHVNDHSSKGDVVIGNDVWIGSDVFIGSGVTIGDGAVLGAKAVVTKDVPPYAMIVGNPGRVVRYRFEKPLVDELLRLAWWDLSDELVDSLLPLLMSNNTEALLSALKRAKFHSEQSNRTDLSNFLGS